MRQLLGGTLLLAWITGLGAFSASRTAQASHRADLRVVTAFASGEIPESVTADDVGNLYFSVGSSIRRRAPNGDVTEFVSLPLPIYALGIKVGPDGCIYSASTSLSDVEGAFVWRACSPGSVEVFAELDQSGAPNDLAFDDEGNLFVTDPVLGRVWVIEPDGKAEVFAEDPLLAGDPDDPALVFRPLGANGIAFDKYDRYLYVSNTDQGSIVRIDVCSRRPALRLFVQDSALRGADGMAFDGSGTLFVAVNGQDALVTVGPARRVRVLAESGLLDSPSSVVFGQTRKDRHTLYVMSSAFSRTQGLRTGTPAPALLALPVSTPGLELP